MILIYEKERTMTDAEYIEREERREAREHAESQIRILLNGVEREKRKTENRKVGKENG